MCAVPPESGAHLAGYSEACASCPRSQPIAVCAASSPRFVMVLRIGRGGWVLLGPPSKKPRPGRRYVARAPAISKPTHNAGVAQVRVALGVGQSQTPLRKK